MTEPEWDDERLDAAFHARFARPAPLRLGKDVHVRIAGTSPARFSVPRLGVPRVGQPWSLAAAAVVVVLVGAAMLVPAALSLPGTSPAPTGASNSEPAATATPTEQALPGAIFGLPIVGLREAIAVRDSDPDDGSEIAVHGWFTPAPPVSCGPPPTGTRVSPIELRCPDDLVWLTGDAESLVHVTGVNRTTDAPQSLAIHPDLDGLATDWFPTLPVPGVDGGSTPADVVFVGHFVDRRANMCQDAEIPACRDRFVVDSVAYVGGVQQPTSRLHMARDAVSSDQDITAVVNAEAPDSPILSMVVVDGGTDLTTIEPSLGIGQERLIDQSAVWVVRVLESGRVVTYIVIDGTDAIYEMNPAGEPILVGGTPPTPGARSSSTPTASPSQGLGYELDCGPLGPDTCQAKAADVIAATPTQRVVSLAFSDECGSYHVTFDDGQWITGEIDCIPGASPS